MFCSVIGIPFLCFDLGAAKTNLLIFLLNLLFPVRRDVYPKDHKDILKNGQEFEYIVVGAGSAGSIVAARLSENDKKVLILEAGGFPSPLVDTPLAYFLLQETKEDWKFKTSSNGQRCLWPRGKVLGGTGSINRMVYARGPKKDYNLWAKMGNKGWSYDDVIQYFKRLERVIVPQLYQTNIYGRHGHLPLSRYTSKEPLRKYIINAWKELGFKYHPLECTSGTFDALLNIEDGYRANPASTFLGQNKDRNNLVLATEAQVVKVIIDNTTNTATGVEVKINGKIIKLYASREVILSAGVVNSPHLLLLSGVGPADQLHKFNIPVLVDLHGVGRNVQDYLTVSSIYVKFNQLADRVLRTSWISNFFQYYRRQNGPLSQIRLSNMLSFLNTRNETHSANVEIRYDFFPINDHLMAKFVQLRHEKKIVNFLLKANKRNSLVGFFVKLLNPKNVGRIVLNSSDPMVQPLIYPGYLDDKDDEQVLFEGINYLERLLHTETMTQLNAEVLELPIPECKGFKFRSEEYWRCHIKYMVASGYQMIGTCKMGPKSDSEAVVNHRLKVYGVKHLRVIDASIMPRMVGGNPVAAVMMIAEKSVEMIIEEHYDDHDYREDNLRDSAGRHTEL